MSAPMAANMATQRQTYGKRLSVSLLIFDLSTISDQRALLRLTKRPRAMLHPNFSDEADCARPEPRDVPSDGRHSKWRKCHAIAGGARAAKARPVRGRG
jgi:hypothetical protein